MVMIEIECPADDERHGDCAGVHDEHVLQAKREQSAGWQAFVDGMDLVRLR